MGYRLQEGVTYCRLNDVIIVLDLKKDRYRALLGPAVQALDDLADQTGSRMPDAYGIDMLVRHGVLNFDPERTDVRPCSSEPASIALHGSRSPGPRQVFSILATIFYVRLLLRRHKVHHVLSRLAHANSSSQTNRKSGKRPPLAVLVARFAAVESCMQRTGNCLSRSIALARYLGRSGYESKLIFGVAINPFRAHCWVEHGDFALNDEPDHIRSFTPIRVSNL